MIKILVSACLEGQPVRYDGKDNLLSSPIWHKWKQEARLISICPEVQGGLSTPRAPAEIISDPDSIHHQQVMTITGDTVTQAFEDGAKASVSLAIQEDIKIAILKANSPSCGNSLIYDGHFNGTKIPGQGITAKALSDIGIRVFNEDQLLQAEAYLNQLTLAAK